MIVRTRGAQLELITQPDHAELAATILAAWRADDLPRRPTRDVLLFATREHDRGWTPVDAAPPLDPATGRPFDFITAPTGIKHAIWPRAVSALGPQSPYAAALVAEHALVVYDQDQFRHAPAWIAFFETMTSARDAWLERSGESSARLQADYRLLRIADLISLVFCNGWPDPASVEGTRIILTGGTLTVSPDPFGGAGLPLQVSMRTIPNRAYASEEDLLSAVQKAPRSSLTGHAIGGS